MKIIFQKYPAKCQISFDMSTVNQPILKKTSVVGANTKQFLLLGDKQARRVCIVCIYVCIVMYCTIHFAPVGKNGICQLLEGKL